MERGARRRNHPSRTAVSKQACEPAYSLPFRGEGPSFKKPRRSVPAGFFDESSLRLFTVVRAPRCGSQKQSFCRRPQCSAVTDRSPQCSMLTLGGVTNSPGLASASYVAWRVGALRSASGSGACAWPSPDTGAGLERIPKAGPSGLLVGSTIGCGPAAELLGVPPSLSAIAIVPIAATPSPAPICRRLIRIRWDTPGS